MIANSKCIVVQRLRLKRGVMIPTEEEVRAYFENFGRVMGVRIKHDDPNVRIVFSSIAEAQKALHTEEHSINGCEFKSFSSARVTEKAM